MAEPDDGSTEDGLPGIEFLEFLGEWETDQGEWLAPQLLDEDIFGDVNEERSRQIDD